MKIVSIISVIIFVITLIYISIMLYTLKKKNKVLKADENDFMNKSIVYKIIKRCNDFLLNNNRKPMYLYIGEKEAKELLEFLGSSGIGNYLRFDTHYGKLTLMVFIVTAQSHFKVC